MTRTYDRRIPEPLPRHRMLTMGHAVPPVVDLRQWCGPIKDQGAEGACTAHAGTSATEWIFRRYMDKAPVFSPQYTYTKELIAQGSFPQDVGSDGVTLCTSLIVNGCCELDLFPYVPGEIIRPNPEQDQSAMKWRMGAYHGLAGSEVALSVLGDPVPWPIAVGFTVYNSFESETGETRIYDPNISRERIRGGHEVVAFGYDIAETPVLRPVGCPPALLIQNSWSALWAEGGFFWMALAVADDPETDMKIVHLGRPW